MMMTTEPALLTSSSLRHLPHVWRSDLTATTADRRLLAHMHPGETVTLSTGGEVLMTSPGRYAFLKNGVPVTRTFDSEDLERNWMPDALDVARAAQVDLLDILVDVDFSAQGGFVLITAGDEIFSATLEDVRFHPEHPVFWIRERPKCYSARCLPELRRAAEAHRVLTSLRS